MNYEQMANIGACGPVGCNPYAAYGAYGYPAPVAAPFFGGGVVQTDIVGRQPAVAEAPRVGSNLTHWDIIGQAPAPAPAPQESWLQQPGPLGVKRLWWLVGAAAIGATWFAYSRGYLGGESRGRDFDFVGGDFYL